MPNSRIVHLEIATRSLRAGAVRWIRLVDIVTLGSGFRFGLPRDFVEEIVPVFISTQHDASRTV
jgi:hypothetical protein